MKTRDWLSLTMVFAVTALAAGPVGARATEVLPAQTSSSPASGKATLQGAWQLEGHSAMLIATATWVAFFGVDSLPALSNYRIEGDRLTLEPSTMGLSFNDQILRDDLQIRPREDSSPVVLERLEITPTKATFVVPNGPTLTWRRLE